MGADILPSANSRKQLTRSEWVNVVIISGLGTILEWFDFYIYTQLSSTLTKAFFPSGNPTLEAISYWGVFAAAFVVRPLGSLIFGHIGDTVGRNRTLTISIICMAVPTIAIGCLPTYDVGSYTAGLAAPILLCLCRMMQGLAMGGEFGAAVIYISELADPGVRGRFVAALQTTVNLGMVIATLLVMILQQTISEENMVLWGWRIPFIVACFTAILGYFLRKGLPEPHIFLQAARAEKEYLEGNTPKADSEAAIQKAKQFSEISESDDEEETALSKLHGHDSHARVPILRLIHNNIVGVVLHVAFMAWVSGAFYLTVSWLMTELKKEHDGLPAMKTIEAQGLLILSLVFNAIGLVSTGYAFDKGLKAIYGNCLIVLAGLGASFVAFLGVWSSHGAAWFLTCMLQLVIGAAMAAVVLPCTRLYDPLERITGFSFAYNCGYGILGGTSPMIVTAIASDLADDIQDYAPVFWLTALAGVSFIGCYLLRMYDSRINKRFVGHLE